MAGDRGGSQCRYRDRPRLVFIALPTAEMAIERIAARVRKGEHDVPAKKVRERWGRAHDNLIRFLERVDDVLVFSNASDEPVVAVERIGRTGPIVLHGPDALPEITRRLRSL